MSLQSSVVSKTKIQSFRDLIIWQKSMDFVTTVYEKTALFPREEQYGLSSQMRRAAISVPSNISEGFRRQHAKEYRQFLAISLGSLGELETHFEIAQRLKYLPVESCRKNLSEIETLCRMIQGLSNKITASQTN